MVLRTEITKLIESPQPEDVLLLIEVAASSLGFDLSVKARLYARAGIVEYWVLDVEGRRVIVHRGSDGQTYQSVLVYGLTEQVATLARPANGILVKHLFEG
jgi:Uma2 family endonuclease